MHPRDKKPAVVGNAIGRANNPRPQARGADANEAKLIAAKLSPHTFARSIKQRQSLDQLHRVQRFESNAANTQTGNQRLHEKALQRQQYRLGANHGDEALMEKARGYNLKMMAQAKYLLSKSSSSRKIIFSKNGSNKQFLSPDRARTLEPADSFSKIRETNAGTKLIRDDEENSDEEVAPNLRNLVNSPNRIRLSSRMVATQESAPDKPIEAQDTGSQ